MLFMLLYAYSVSCFQFLFYEKLRNLADHVLIYEEPELRSKALKIMPVDEFKKKAKEASKKSKEDGGEGKDEADCLLLELASWYKSKSAFWVDNTTVSWREGEELRAQWHKLIFPLPKANFIQQSLALSYRKMQKWSNDPISG